MSDWRRLTFSDAVLINPTVKLDKGVVYPFVEMAALQPEGKFVYASEKRIFSTSGSRFADGDTLFSRITPCLENGKIAMYRAVDKGRPAHGSTEFIIFRGKPSITTNEFIHYVATSPRVREFAIAKMTGTSGRQRVPITAFQHLDVHVPNIETQKTITGLLCALDDKIDLNRRMNETLESMARVLFKDWFVDFGPTRAKAEGRPPYLAPEIWELFPDALDEEDKPVGWTSATLGEVIEILDSKRIPLSSREREKRPGPYPYHGATGVMEYVDDYLFEGVHVLIGEDGSVIKENGKPFTQYIWGKFWVNNHAHVIRGQGVSTEHLLCFFEQLDISPYVTGAVQPKLNQGNLKSIPFVNPGEVISEAFDNSVDALFSAIRANSGENRTLAQLRDLLLPKLVSGEIRLRDAEKVVEAVA